jgi:glycine cleavage system H protein
MNIPGNLKYSKTDEWVKIEENTVTIGITDYAQHQLSDIVYIEVSLSIGDQVKKNSPCATVESVKAAADVNLPVSGKVLEVNESLSSSPEMINSDPYGKAWMVKIEFVKPDEISELMDAQAYESYCQSRSH